MDKPTTGGQHARTAMEHLERDVPVLSPELSAAAARKRLTGRRFAYAGQVAVCRGTRFLGLLPIETLLAAPDEAPLYMADAVGTQTETLVMAFGAGPLATVVQDLLSISVYLMLARLLVA